MLLAEFHTDFTAAVFVMMVGFFFVLIGGKKYTESECKPNYRLINCILSSLDTPLSQDPHLQIVWTSLLQLSVFSNTDFHLQRLVSPTISFFTLHKVFSHFKSVTSNLPCFSFLITQNSIPFLAVEKNGFLYSSFIWCNSHS